MATNKTIRPSGATVVIPDFDEKPDARVYSQDISKLADNDNALSDELNSYATIPSGGDLNDYETFGYYYFASSDGLSNAPKAGLTYGMLIVFGAKAGTQVRVVQLCSTSGNHLYYRRRVGSTSDVWSAWREITMAAVT